MLNNLMIFIAGALIGALVLFVGIVAYAIVKTGSVPDMDLPDSYGKQR